MISNRKQLAQDALIASSKLRKRYGYDQSSPISIFDLADKSGVPVRFVEINMEGMYVHLGEGMSPTIFVSALRPFHRKIFTCAHEYGHHYFGHGLTIDQIEASDGAYDSKEFLVDCLAGYLLMPPLGIKKAFDKRQLTFNQAASLDYFKIACSFGVGYSTLIKHLLFNLQIDHNKANTLLRQKPKFFKESIVGPNVVETLFFVDEHFSNTTFDIETTSYIVLPKTVLIDKNKHLKFCKEVKGGILYQALSPGLARIFSDSNEWNCFLRIQKFQYIGLSKFRHLAE